MNYGIVGSEQAKFTPRTEQLARNAIKQLLTSNDTVVSGECHLSGVDIYAKEIALELQLNYLGFPPARRHWEGGYKQRNMLIAQNSDIVICVTVFELPETYTGMRFEACYHCPKGSEPHIKSGGCWTLKYAKSLNKFTKLIVIR